MVKFEYPIVSLGQGSKMHSRAGSAQVALVLVSSCGLVLALVASATPAANALPIFLSGKIGNASLDASFGDRFNQVLDGDDDAWALGLGYRLGKRWVFMAEYHDLGNVPGLGSPCPQNVEACTAVVVPIEADSSATTLSAQPREPVYVGVRVCTECHRGPNAGHTFSKWRLTPHAKAQLRCVPRRTTPVCFPTAASAAASGSAETGISASISMMLPSRSSSISIIPSGAAMS